jgi:hypothetical protein
MLDFYADEEEIYLADYDILQVISANFDQYSVEAIAMKGGRGAHLDLLYSNSICKQSSIPTSILMELLLSGGIR